MTPTEQDKELREKLNSHFESVFSQGVRAGKDVATETYEDFNAWRKGDELDEIMQLITADRKRVALGAELQLLTYLLDERTEHMFMQNPDTGEITGNGWLCNTSLSAVSANRIEAERRKRIAELKQELEKL